MKFFLRFFAASLLLSQLCFQTHCKRKVKLAYEGTVYDTMHIATSKPVPGVEVTLYYCDGKLSGNSCTGSLHQVAAATSDANGHFSFGETTKMERRYQQVFYIRVKGSPFYGSAEGYSLADLPRNLYLHPKKLSSGYYTQMKLKRSCVISVP